MFDYKVYTWAYQCNAFLSRSFYSYFLAFLCYSTLNKRMNDKIVFTIMLKFISYFFNGEKEEKNVAIRMFDVFLRKTDGTNCIDKWRA